MAVGAAGGGQIPWVFSQVKGTIEEEVAEGKEITYKFLC